MKIILPLAKNPADRLCNDPCKYNPLGTNYQNIIPPTLIDNDMNTIIPSTDVINRHHIMLFEIHRYPITHDSTLKTTKPATMITE